MPLSPGDLVFVGWDSDNNDVTFVATAPIAEGEVIYFTDDEWDGTQFIGNEQLIEWIVPAGGLDVGDVITVNQAGNAPPLEDRAIVEDQDGDPVGDTTYIRGGGQMAGGNEMFWAVQGTVDGNDRLIPDPGGFISVIGNEADGGNTQTPNLTNTGLTTSTGAVIIDGDEDYMEFTSDENAFPDQATLLAQVGDPSNWTTADGGGNNNPNVEGFDINFTNIYCFTPGVMIDTPEGPRPVEDLIVGDLVCTRDRGPQPIRYIARRVLKRNELEVAPHLKPILIRKDALEKNVPNADMKVSPQHRMLITGWRAELLFGQNEVLTSAHSLVNDKMIRIAHGARRVEYIHLLFDNHEVITANTAPSESLHPGKAVIDGMPEAARAELLEIFPELHLAISTGAMQSAETILRRFEGEVLAPIAIRSRPFRRNRRRSAKQRLKT
ncbi:MAG: Hint domain-containing protein [Pseudomonadota bacterium]